MEDLISEIQKNIDKLQKDLIKVREHNAELENQVGELTIENDILKKGGQIEDEPETK